MLFANHPSDFFRLDIWVARIKIWLDEGLNNLNFFVHQNMEKDSHILANYFIKKLNEKDGGLKVRGHKIENSML